MCGPYCVRCSGTDRRSVALVRGPYGPIECLVTGSDQPVTLFAHGFAGSIEETRPFGSGVRGSRVFFSFRAHGSTPPVGLPWTYAGLAAELSSVRTAYGATRGLGVSIGAGALLRAAVDGPGTFERLVVVLPPALDGPRRGRALERVKAMARCADAHDVDGLRDLLLAEQPARPSVPGGPFRCGPGSRPNGSVATTCATPSSRFLRSSRSTTVPVSRR